MTETDENHAYVKKAKPLKEKKNRREKSQKQPKQKKKSKLRLILLIVAAVLVLSVAGYFVFRSQSVDRYATVSTVGETLTNKAGTIEITFTQAETITDITGYDLDSDYVYVALNYTVKNVSDEAITWEDYPLVSILDFTKKGDEYETISDSEADYDFNALQYYSIEMGIDYTTILDDLATGEERVDADIFKIPADEFDADTQFISIEDVDTLVQIEDTRTTTDSTDSTE
jgi:hypothetical protein